MWTGGIDNGHELSGVKGEAIWTHHPYDRHHLAYKERDHRPVAHHSDHPRPAGIGHLAGDLPL